jgi:type 1 fimbriae regulatory protein FimB/type 1 fimbriae regulatory protein FimE
MLRHACGYKLAHDGHDTRAIQEWLGHRNIQHTTRYTELTTKRFKDFLISPHSHPAVRSR